MAMRANLKEIIVQLKLERDVFKSGGNSRPVCPYSAKAHKAFS